MNRVLHRILAAGVQIADLPHPGLISYPSIEGSLHTVTHPTLVLHVKVYGLKSLTEDVVSGYATELADAFHKVVVASSLSPCMPLIHSKDVKEPRISHSTVIGLGDHIRPIDGYG